VIGLTQSPAGIDVLPHLKQQLAGLKIRDASEALNEWLPKARGESDRVVLMYYGTPTSLAPIRERFGKDLLAICIGGARPEEIAVPADAAPTCPIVASDQHGKDLAILAIGSPVRLLPITPDIASDEKVAVALAPTKPTQVASDAPTSAPTTAPSATVAATPAPASAPATAPAVARTEQPAGARPKSSSQRTAP
jgi:hypothetical protein